MIGLTTFLAGFSMAMADQEIVLPILFSVFAAFAFGYWSFSRKKR